MVDKIFDPNLAATAYGNASKMGSMPGMRSQKEDQANFADILKEATESSIETLKQGEKMSAKAIAGEADLTDVVEAVTSAELTLQTVISIRDRMVSSYQQIMRMPI